jgi:hypothetical protein
MQSVTTRRQLTGGGIIGTMRRMSYLRSPLLTACCYLPFLQIVDVLKRACGGWNNPRLVLAATSNNNDNNIGNTHKIIPSSLLFQFLLVVGSLSFIKLVVACCCLLFLELATRRRRPFIDSRRDRRLSYFTFL